MALPWSFVSKNINSKHQITNKSQIPIFNSTVVAKRLLWLSRLTKTFQDETLFVFSNFGHWSLFDIWHFNKSMNFQQSKSPLGTTKAGSSGPGFLLRVIVALRTGCNT